MQYLFNVINTSYPLLYLSNHPTTYWSNYLYILYKYMHCTVTEPLKGLISNFNELKTSLRNFTLYLENKRERVKNIYNGYHGYLSKIVE